MKTEPITPARIDFGAVPSAPQFGDVYHPRVGALEQARHVFLHGNGLPRRWAGRPRFTILETGFGLGNNFLATWDAWRSDAARCARLHFVSIELHPPCAADLARAHAASPLAALAAPLLAAWPPLTPNLHLLDFDGGRVQLLLAFGDVARLLPELRLAADAFFLDGFAPARNPQMWQPAVLKSIARKAAPGATLATWSVAGDLRDGLAAAGFDVRLAPGCGGKREITLATYAPRHARPVQAPPPAAAVGAQAVVVGGGIAGAAAARALHLAGLEVTVVDRHATPAAGASGNPAGLFHGTVHRDDGPHARLFRAAALQAQRDYGGATGLLRQGDDLAAMAALLRRRQLPADYVQALDAAAASALAGVELVAPAWWFYPGGGALDAAHWIGLQLAGPGVRWVGAGAVARLQRDLAGWRVVAADGSTLATAAVVVLANAGGALPLLAPLSPLAPPAWPLSHQRGQVTLLAPAAARSLRLPVAGDGYAIPLADGGLLCGATREPGEPDGSDGAGSAALRDEDHRHNLERLHRLTGLQAPDDPARWSGRAGWRLQAGDRLPIAGAVPAAAPLPGPDRLRLLAREPGLFVLSALGARGLTLAPLLGRLLAAQATGAPWPLEQDLAEAVDPGRWRVRAARRAHAAAAAAAATAGASQA